VLKTVLVAAGYMIISVGIPIALAQRARHRLKWSNGGAIALGIGTWLGISLIFGVLAVAAMSM
jgi:hypothetical protein